MIAKLIPDELLDNMPGINTPLPDEVAEMPVVCKIDSSLPDWETFYVAGKLESNGRILAGFTVKDGRATAQTISLNNLENGGDMLQFDNKFPSTTKFGELINFSLPPQWKLR